MSPSLAPDRGRHAGGSTAKLPSPLLLVLGILLLPSAPRPAVAQSEGLVRALQKNEESAKETEQAKAQEEEKKEKQEEVQWYVDENGREYQLATYPKKGLYQVLEGGKRLRTRFGVVVEVVKEDEDFFYYKLYKPQPVPTPTPKPEPSPEERAAIAAAYEADVPTEERFRFEPFDRGLSRKGQWRNGFDVADMNGDGHPDLVHGTVRPRNFPPVIFLGDGEGGWTPWRDTEFPPLRYQYGDVAAGDLDGDGVNDLVVAMHHTGIVVLRGDGQGRFTPWSEGVELERIKAGLEKSDDPKAKDEVAFTSRSIDLGDMNRDGRLDIVALSEGPRGFEHAHIPKIYGVVVYLNQGDGSWKEVRAHPSGEGLDHVYGDSVEVGEVNGDGLPDFVLGTRLMIARQIIGLGHGDGSWTLHTLDAVRAPSILWATAVADLDSDGRSDLVVGYSSRDADAQWRSGIDLYFGGGDGEYRRVPLAAVDGKAEVYSVAAGDLDADGAVDVVGATGDGRVWVFTGRGDGSFARQEMPEMSKPYPQCRSYHLQLADLDGRPGDEIVASFAGEPCPGHGSFRAWRVVPRDAGAAAAPKDTAR